MLAAFILASFLVVHTTSFTNGVISTRYVQVKEEVVLWSTIASLGEETTTSTVVQNPISALLTSVLQTGGTSHDVGGIFVANQGIQVWKHSLIKGRLPSAEDFASTDAAHAQVWPAEPLFTKLCEAMVEMQLPRFVRRHPEIVTTVIRMLLRMTVKFHQELEASDDDDTDDEEDDNDDNDEDYDYYDDGLQNADFSIDNEIDVIHDTANIEAEIAESLRQEFVNTFSGVVAGVGMLDALFGMDHGLLQISNENDGMGPPSDSFGFEDGVWQHSGWKMIPDLQNQVSAMPELKDLMNILGRRPTAESSTSVEKFAPRRLDRDGGLGAQFDPQMRESVSGITFTGSLTDMLPSEAILLKGSPTLRRLFLAKKAESKLLSYQLSGWEDVLSAPKPRSNYLTRMPSAPGGSVIVCLDTSWSMSGSRERLSKAVVLACVSMASKQGRDCQIIAFSGTQGTMDSGIITPSPDGIRRLLDFLSFSFGGGTDVTGALKFAMDTLDNQVMASSDILLVTDGEIPDPPVSDEFMQRLESLKVHTGVEIHGLLVGKRESIPLNKICTASHDFLLNYDTLVPTNNLFKGTDASSPSLSVMQQRFARFMVPTAFAKTRLHQPCRKLSHLHLGQSVARRYPFQLQAKYYDDDGAKPGRKTKRSKKKSKWDDSDDEDDDYYNHDDDDSNRVQTVDEDSSPSLNDETQQAIQRLHDTADSQITATEWTPTDLDAELERSPITAAHRNDINRAISVMAQGLIERDEEARLIVLAAIAQEHILLLGCPGTAKSQLGRRLANILGNDKSLYFQRLFTKFTTPEEIFGPLSLRALENDEYRRQTQGFLPTASVAFLDEIFKANSAILNTLLTILNERKFDNGAGGVPDDCPIQCVVGASNELPESDELDALYDRFLIRKEVLSVSEEGMMELLLTTGESPCDQDGCDVNAIPSIIDIVNERTSALPRDVALLVRDLCSYLRQEHEIAISDRRIVKSSRLLKIAAACDGRERVDLTDCLLLEHVLWHQPEERMIIREWLWDHVTPCGMLNNEQSNELLSFRLVLESLRSEASMLLGSSTSSASSTGSASTLTGEIETLVSTVTQKRNDCLRHAELLKRKNKMWFDSDTSLSLEQLLLPKGQDVIVELTKTLRDGISLRGVVSSGTVGVVEDLWDDNYSPEVKFSKEELTNMSMKEAKSKYDLETFRKWKRARKKEMK